MKNTVLSTIAKSLVLGVFSIALLFSCQNPLTVESAGESARAAAYTDYREFSQDPPAGLTPAQVPQFVILGYDDNQYADGMYAVMDLYKGKFNPAGVGNPYTFDGSPATASFYVVPSGKDQSTGETWMTSDDAVDSWKYAYRRGHEIGNHTWDHSPGGTSRSAADWEWQISKCQDFLVNRMGLPAEDVIGFRTPFLEYNTNTFNSMKANGLLYDVSFEGGWRYWPAEDGSTLFWPATMDNGKPAGEDGRDFGKQTGVWVIPNDCLFDGSGRITGFDYNLWFSKSTTKQQFFDILKYSLDKKYNGNRSPMKFGTHTNYYSYNGDAGIKQWDAASYAKLKEDVQGRLDGVEMFIDYALTLPDVRMVTAAQALQWLRNPVALTDAPATTHTIVADAGIGGIISPEGSQLYVPGTSKTYYIDVDPGYLLSSVIVDGVDQGPIKEYTFANITGNHSISASFHKPSVSEAKKSSILSLTSIAENSQTTLKFDYAEDIGDGRGITFGAVGFTSGTWDGTLFLKRLQSVDATHPLVSYIPAFEAIDALPHPNGKCNDMTGLDNFIADFQKHGLDDTVVQAQLSMLDELYYNPSLVFYNEIGGTLAITEGFLYDSCVNHGAESWEGEKGLDTLVAETNAAMGGTPKTGVNEVAWVSKLMEIRKAYLLSDATWQMAEDRVTMYQDILATGNTSLTNPFDAECYGGYFTIWGNEIKFPSNLPKFNLTINAGPGGTAMPEGIFQVTQGSGINITVTADAGYLVDTIALDGVVDTYFGNEEKTTYYFQNVQADHVLDITFKQPASVIVTATAGANGSISPAGAVSVIEGGDKAFTITPDFGYQIETVTVGGVDAKADVVNGVLTLTNVTAATTVDATFSVSPIPQYTITATAGANGDISPASAVVLEGGSQTFTMTPAAGYMVADVLVDGASVGAVTSYTFSNVTANATIEASFAIVPDCTVDEYVDGQVYTGGAIVHYQGEHYKAKWWTQYEAPPGTTGVWEWVESCGPVVIEYFDITASAGANGTITPAGTQNVAEGTVVSYAIAADAGYQIADVTVNGVSKGKVSSLDVTVNAATTVVASFEVFVQPTFYDITASAGLNGSITPAGTQSVEEGTVVSYTIAADAGYQIADVTVNGVSQGAVATLDVTVTAATTVEASFKVKDTSGTPEWSADSVAYALGDEVTYNGAVYVCKYAHTSNSAWVPGTPGLWIWELK